MADPSGNYDLLVSLGISRFDYASSQLTLVDSISDNTLGLEALDLSRATRRVPSRYRSIYAWAMFIVRLQSLTALTDDVDVGRHDTDREPGGDRC